jgi:L-threonylcarbamoyladenylate synthase
VRLRPRSRSVIDSIVQAIRAGKPVVLPTDTVYGLCVNPNREEFTRRLYQLKGRDAFQPTALLASDVDALLDCVPELRARSRTIARALLPGPYTLVFENPAQRFPWLTGSHPETIGVRVPELSGEVRAVLDRVGAVAATSANRPGESDPRRLDDVPSEIRAGCAGALDAGELPGVSSTVVDCTGPEPRILREGAVPAAEALTKIGAILGADTS